MHDLALGWLLATNVLALAIYWLDKRKAVRRQRRIPEAQLLLVAACGGAPGAWLACSLFRHKTQKRSFRAKLIVASLLCGALGWGYVRFVA
ncbi:MAG: DUF1294 domain-containing protein [Planctomycetes bacterium]|nr:DUF1294 domain-containing protein [Planctomycetota bacterium]